MADFLNRAKMTTATTGTGTVTLLAAVTQYQTWAAAGAINGKRYSYVIEDGNNWEVGRGTYSSTGPTLTRDDIAGSSNSGSAINLSGNAQVAQTALAEDIGVSLPGGMTKDPRFLPIVDATGSVYTDGSGALNAASAGFWAIDRSGVGGIGAVSTSATSDTYGTICDISGMGYLFHVIPALHSATTDTVSFEITVDGVVYEIQKTGEMITNSANGRLILGCADLVGANTFYTSAGKHLEGTGNNSVTTGSFQGNGGGVAYIYQPWRILMHGMTCVYFENSLKVRTKVSNLNASGAYRQYSAATYKLL